MTRKCLRRALLILLASGSVFVCTTGNAGDAGWSTDVIGITEMQLSADYWVKKTDSPDEVLKELEEIDAFNREGFAEDPNMVDLEHYPATLAGDEVRRIIRSISKPYSKDLFYRDDASRSKVGAKDYARYTANLDLDAIPDVVDVRFGMVLARANMRTWPTLDVVYKSQETIDLDRFQENGLFPADAVAVLQESADGHWYFVQSFNYAAWVPKDKVALGERAAIFDYRHAPHFLIVTGSKVTTNYNPHVPELSELQLDMGVRLPLADAEERSNNVDGQNPYASYAVRLPIADKDGKLGFHTALIARSQDVQIGYLPYTRRNIIGQAFKFLGERYGWGHSYNARDCTGLVSEVYKTFGIYLPRNSGQQGHSPIGESTHFDPGTSAAEKMAVLATADVGDLLYAKGHVMMYLGEEDGEPYVIHDLSGSGWTGADGEFREGVLNGVSVTPLTPLHSSPETTYFEQMYALKKIR